MHTCPDCGCACYCSGDIEDHHTGDEFEDDCTHECEANGDEDEDDETDEE